MLTNAVAEFYECVANETTTRHMRLICIYGIADVFLFLIFPSTCSISILSVKFCLLSAFLLYSIRMLANLYKHLTITTNALLLIRMACNCLRICGEYRNLGKCFQYSQYLLNGPNAYEYERMPSDELANIVICKRIGAIMVSPVFSSTARSAKELL